MPIDLNLSFNDTRKYIGSSKVVSSIFGSSIWLSIVIVILIVILLMYFCPSFSKSSKVVKFVFYSFICVAFAVFCHDNVLESEFEKTMTEKLSHRIIDAASDSAGIVDDIPVIEQKRGGQSERNAFATDTTGTTPVDPQKALKRELIRNKLDSLLVPA